MSQGNKITLRKPVWFLKHLDDPTPLHRLEPLPQYVGSAPDNDIQLTETGVEAYHARFEDSQDGLVLYDLGSRAGVLVGGVPETAVCFPKEQDSFWIVEFGQAIFELHYAKISTQTPPPLPTAPYGTQPPPLPGFESKPPALPGYQEEKPATAYRKKSIKVFKNKQNTENPDAAWFYEHQGVTVGPLTSEEMFAAVEKENISPGDAVWKKDKAVKTLAYKVKNLFPSDVVEEYKAQLEANEAKDDVKSAVEENRSGDPPSFARSDSSPGPGLADTGHGSVTCPSCWYKFNPEDALFISMHPDLIGDKVLGTDEPKRFLPTRFTPEGLALDDKGMRCTDAACPRCHMRIPTSIMVHRPIFLSIVGAPGSGKSHALAAAAWQMRTLLPGSFQSSFHDIDAVTNLWLNDYEQKLFFGDDAAVASTLKKTDENDGHTYKPVMLDGMQIFLPKPCMFVVGPSGGGDAGKSCLVLYDNAGEHFGAGKDHVTQPGTKHLVHSEGVLFLYDPIGDPRMRAHLRKSGLDHFESRGTFRQDVLLLEMVDRIRRHAGLMNGEPYEKPLVIALSKADLFGNLFDLEEMPVETDPQTGRSALNMRVIMEMSQKVRSLMTKFSPEVVNTVETFAREVIYLPLSGLGHNPDAENRLDTQLLEPKWVEVPFLYFLARLGLIPSRENTATLESGSVA